MKFKKTEVFLFLLGSFILLGVLTTRAPAGTNSPMVSIITIADGGEPPPPPLRPPLAAKATPVLVADGGETPPPPLPIQAPNLTKLSA